MVRTTVLEETPPTDSSSWKQRDAIPSQPPKLCHRLKPLPLSEWLLTFLCLSGLVSALCLRAAAGFEYCTLTLLYLVQ
jgi:hypothetical protein